MFAWLYLQPRSSVSMNEWGKYETGAELRGKTWGKRGTRWDQWLVGLLGVHVLLETVSVKVGVVKIVADNGRVGTLTQILQGLQ